MGSLSIQFGLESPDYIYMRGMVASVVGEPDRVRTPATEMPGGIALVDGEGDNAPATREGGESRVGRDVKRHETTVHKNCQD